MSGINVAGKPATSSLTAVSAVAWADAAALVAAEEVADVALALLEALELSGVREGVETVPPEHPERTMTAEITDAATTYPRGPGLRGEW
ncbi:hypothetical protein [Arthrobacter cryoconiti]|uniref:Uncharacterized protein n=1 Tax=Arthrobacter cryoconiti TaxID=748907 RepID=A0ABV8R254_9MICC|nr:hypothetical protein [Arthrobacter cryoconiti]